MPRGGDGGDHDEPLVDATSTSSDDSGTIESRGDAEHAAAAGRDVAGPARWRLREMDRRLAFGLLGSDVTLLVLHVLTIAGSPLGGRSQWRLDIDRSHPEIFGYAKLTPTSTLLLVLAAHGAGRLHLARAPHPVEQLLPAENLVGVAEDRSWSRNEPPLPAPQPSRSATACRSRAG